MMLWRRMSLWRRIKADARLLWIDVRLLWIDARLLWFNVCVSIGLFFCLHIMVIDVMKITFSFQF